MLCGSRSAPSAAATRRRRTDMDRSRFLMRMTRREAMTLLGSGAGLVLARTLGDNPAQLFAQPGGWFSAPGSKPTFPKGSVIRTIAKDIPPESLANGSVQIHEHIGGQFRPTPPPPAGSEMVPGVVAPKNEAEYLDLMVEALKMARVIDGVSCLVDCASSGRRDDRTVENLKTISTRSGVHVVVGGGYYQDLAIPAKYPAEITQMPEDKLEEHFTSDAQKQRWGAYAEIASSQTMQPEERKLLRAIGK